MGIEIEPEWQPATKLNVVGGALDFTSVEPIPDGVTRDRIEEICYTIRELYGEYVDELVAETGLSRREAQTWVLRTLAHQGTDRLSYEAVGLYIWAIGRATEGDPLSRTIVTDYYERAERKIERAEATLKRAGPPPYPDDVYDDPAVLWVDAPVADRLRERRQPEETYSDVIERLLDGTTAGLSLAELIETYRSERGSDYVAVETVYPEWDHEFRLVVGVDEPGATPAAVERATALRVGDEPRAFTVDETTEPTHADAHLVGFADTADLSVPVEDGVETVRRALAGVERTLPELVDDLRSAGGTALAVADEPAGAGANLHPVFPESAPADALAHLERLALDDRTLSVGRVSPVDAEKYRGSDHETTLLWAGDGGDLGRRPLPDDPAERRELFPARVLATST